jgi:hypothetical protein
VSNWWKYNIWRSGTKENYEDIPWRTGNIVGVAREYTSLGSTCGYHIFLMISQQLLGFKNLSFVGEFTTNYRNTILLNFVLIGFTLIVDHFN